MAASLSSPSIQSRTAARSGFLDSQKKQGTVDESALAIRDLKRRLDDLNATHMQKEVAIAARQQAQLERDEAARLQWAATHRTEEEQRAQQLEDRRLQFIADLAAVEVSEEYNRGLLEQESQLESAVIGHHDHLAFIALTVRRVAAEIDRKQRVISEREKWKEELGKVQLAARKVVDASALSQREAIVKEELRSRRDLERHAPTSMSTAIAATSSRLAKEAADEQMMIALALQREEEKRDEEVAAMEAACEDRFLRLTAKFAQLTSSPAIAPPQ